MEGLPSPTPFEKVGSSQPDREPDSRVRPEDLALLQYAGGTTGTTKAVI